MDVGRLLYRILMGGMVASVVLFLSGLAVKALNYSVGAFLLTAGTATLILTPLARVLASITAFVANKDAKYAILAGIVLIVMLASIALGLSFLGR